ncbi:MAG: hypothetical protein KTR31_35630 [Myxococcales bacterium]|nr:hypothetical protein [Myxococcales bacterium]
MPKVRQLHQRDWDQLLMVASGFLPMTNGNLREAMARAIAAHADLIRAVREDGVTTELSRGKVTLFVPEGGGLALAFESSKAAAERRRAPGATDSRPPVSEFSLEVLEPSEYIAAPEDDRGPVKGDWPEVG